MIDIVDRVVSDIIVFIISVVLLNTTNIEQRASCRRINGLPGSVIGHRSIAPGFKPRTGYTRRVFHLSLRLITFEGRSAHLGYLVHKSDRKTRTFTFVGEQSSNEYIPGE